MLSSLQLNSRSLSSLDYLDVGSFSVGPAFQHTTIYLTRSPSRVTHDHLMHHGSHAQNTDS